VSASPGGGQPLRMPTATCLFTLIRTLPTAVVDLVLGPDDQIAYVTVTTR